MDIFVAQINPIVGDLKTNSEKIREAIQRGKNARADLVVFSELALTGYPPKDLLLIPSFKMAVDQSLEEIIVSTKGIGVILGVPREEGSYRDRKMHNSAALIHDGLLIDFADKILLPTYDVFDEMRYFVPGTGVKIWNFKGMRFAITICEDIWYHGTAMRETWYSRDPISELKHVPIDAIINLSASPYSFYKLNKRLETFSAASKTLNCPVIFCNQVGGNDQLIFDGMSFYMQPNEGVTFAKGFAEDDLLVKFSSPTENLSQKSTAILDAHPIENLYQALVLGTRDYFVKLGFKKACIGLSGGIDSAVVACIAQEALGADSVLGLTMPSRYSSPESARDATLLAQHLKIRIEEISIESPFESYIALLKPYFKDKEEDFTEENLQARIRGMLLMAFSNKFGYIVLSTSNKSELAMGFSTLYGDLCGALNVLGDVTKCQVYALAQYINEKKKVISEHTLSRPPSAELRPNQKDSDSLPDYAILDPIIQAYIEDYQSAEQIAHHFHYPLALVQDVIKRIHLSEYKRRQGPLSLRVSEKSFSLGRQFPIVQGWVK